MLYLFYEKRERKGNKRRWKRVEKESFFYLANKGKRKKKTKFWALHKKAIHPTRNKSD